MWTLFYVNFYLLTTLLFLNKINDLHYVFPSFSFSYFILINKNNREKI